jgi:hypothetical protein
MYHKSPFPEIEPYPEANYFHTLLGRPDQQEWPDYTLHIDVLTGIKRSFRQHLERVRYAANALGGEIEHGGLGLRGEDGERVGILGDNSTVRANCTYTP